MATNQKANILTVRSAMHSLLFLTETVDGALQFHQYEMNNGMSVSANLRIAFKEEQYLQQPFDRAVLMLDTPVLLVPRIEFVNTPDFDPELMYSTVMPQETMGEKMVHEIDELNVVGIYNVNSDLRMVLNDNCPNSTTLPLMMPVWQHLYQRYYHNGERRKLFCYFHDQKVDICSFEQQRLSFANNFSITCGQDAFYYMMLVWQQLGMNQHRDTIIIIGDMPDSNWLNEQLTRHISHYSIINPTVALNRSPKASMQQLPFDMML